MKVNVSDFRDQIESCEDQLRCHWHACVNDQERINWFRLCFRAFTRLSDMNCPRAKDSDINRRERVIDQFATFSGRHEQLWLAARNLEV